MGLPEVRQLLIESRKRYNTRAGVFNGDPKMENFIEHADSLNTELFCLLSDGAKHPSENGYIEAAHKIIESSLEEHWLTLSKLYDSDPEFSSYPRFKHIDDYSGMIVSCV